MNVELIDVSCVVAWLKNKKKGKGHKKPLFLPNIVIEKKHRVHRVNYIVTNKEEI